MKSGRYLDLYDFRRRVFAFYAERNNRLARGDDPAEVLAAFRRQRDELFAMHPQSALDEQQKAGFSGLAYFPYDPEAVVLASVNAADGGSAGQRQRIEVELGDGEFLPLVGSGTLRFSWQGKEASLVLYWIEVYGGGLFLPFRDETAPRETYGGGRYLFDTVKGSDFRWTENREIVLDFNYAYNPSCAYNYRWVCPLAPPENHLSFRIEAGERVYAGVPAGQ